MEKSDLNINNKTSGWADRLRNATPDVIKNNASRIVGAMKVLACSAMVIQSKDTLFRIAGGVFIAAYGIMAAFGSKKTAEQKEQLRKENETKKVKKGFRGHLQKISQPRKYPIETAETVSAIGSSFWLLGGLFVNDGEKKIGRFIAGSASLASDLNSALTKEKIGDPEANPHTKGTLKYYATELKNRPILMSSALNSIALSASIFQGLRAKFSKTSGKKDTSDLWAGVMLLAANLFQLIFVNKNDYSIEKSADEYQAIASGKEKENSSEIVTSTPLKLEPQKSSWSERTQKEEVLENDMKAISFG